MASLVQDVWLGWEPRLRGRRLAPWEPPRVRLLFHLDAGSTVDDPPVARFLDALAARLEVVAWAAPVPVAARDGAALLEGARRLVALASSRWGELPAVIAGHGLGGWLALALADSPGVAAGVALAPSLAAAGPPPSPLRAAITAALARPPLAVPTLVLEGRDRAPAEAEAVSAWVAREPRAARLLASGADDVVLAPTWAGAVAAWAEAVAPGAREGSE